MKKHLSVMVGIALLSVNAFAGGPLGGGAFQGGSNWSCTAGFGYKCAGPLVHNFSATAKISENSYEWSASDAFGNVVWSYVIGLQLISQTGGQTIYAASIDQESLGNLICEGDKCIIQGKDTCEANSLCEWSITFTKQSDGGIHISTAGKFHVIADGGMMVILTSLNIGFMKPAASEIVVPQRGQIKSPVFPPGQ